MCNQSAQHEVGRPAQFGDIETVGAGVLAGFAVAAETGRGATAEPCILVLREREILIVDGIHSGTEDVGDRYLEGAGALTIVARVTAVRHVRHARVGFQQFEIVLGDFGLAGRTEKLVDEIRRRHRDDSRVGGVHAQRPLERGL